jgi:hypothetical protein
LGELHNTCCLDINKTSAYLGDGVVGYKVISHRKLEKLTIIDISGVAKLLIEAER